ncbi:hypothetical protein Tco_1082925 [Tanacetum coccineum]|uniref:Uncharacterized protein n=1 Tax=Tanacetum coccineum TaxID=301880 RepID=A0ABQ5I395_9ASTR
MNEDYYHEQNSCYDPNSFGFDKFQPSQYTVNHPIFNAQNELLNSQNKIIEQMTSICDMDDNEGYTIAITPVLSTKEPVDSLIMEDEHLALFPSRNRTNDDDSPTVRISIMSSIHHPDAISTSTEVGGDSNPEPTPLPILLAIKFFPPHSHKSLLLKETNTFDNSIPESKTFCFDLEENSSGSTTTRSDYSLLDYEAFYLNDDHIEEKSSGSTTTHADFSQYDSFIFDLWINPFPPADRSDCYHEEFAGELAHIISPPRRIFSSTLKPRVHVPNILPTHPTLHLDSDFTLSSDSLGSDLVVSFPSRTRNKIFDPGIFIGVHSMIFLSPDEFSFSFIRDPPLPVIDTLLPFSSENENKVVNTGILASEEKYPPSLSHRGFKSSKLSHHKSPMLIHGDNTPNLGVRHPHFYPL